MDTLFLQNYSFFSAFGVALLLGILSPLVGIFLVMRRFSLLADTLAHVSLFGVALCSFFGLPVTTGAFLGAVFGGGAIELFRQSRRVLSEATLALFLSGSLSLAVLLFAIKGIDAEEIEAYLFGDLTLVVGHDFFLLLGIACILIAFFLAFYRKLFLATLDEDLAKVNGVPVRRLNLIFMLFASMVVAVSIKIVGVLLVSSLIVLPVMAALQWQLGFKKTLLLSLGISELTVICGFMLAFLWNIPSGAAIALCTLIAFLVSYFVQYMRP